MTRDEFIQGLKDDVYIEDYFEHSLKRYEYVKWYMENESILKLIGGTLAKPKTIADCDSINYMFSELKLRYGH